MCGELNLRTTAFPAAMHPGRLKEKENGLAWESEAKVLMLDGWASENSCSRYLPKKDFFKIDHSLKYFTIEGLKAKLLY